MSNFLEGLVMRAAGLPPSTTAAPRSAPPPEAVEPETTLEEVIDATPAPMRVEAPRERSAPTIERVAAPVRPHEPERVTEIRETPAAAPLPLPPLEHSQDPQPTPLLAEPARGERELVTQLVEREIVRDPSVDPPAPLIVRTEGLRAQPLPPIPRETREEPPAAAPPAPRETPEEEPQPQAPVVVQPVIVDRTRTIVEPLVREDRTLAVEREVVRESAPAIPRDAAPPPRVDPHPEPPDEADADIPPQVVRAELKFGRADELPEHEDEDERSPLPQTQVLPQPAPSMADEPLPVSAQPEQPPVSIRIGTIEIRAAAPPPPPPAPAPAPTPQQLPEPPSNFDDYSRIRRYAPPEVW